VTAPDQAASDAKRPLRFLFVSEEALIGDLALAVKREGHEVRYFIKSKMERDVCDGFIQKVDSISEHVDWADCVVFDDVGFGEQAEKLRKEGKAVVGGTKYADKLEDDRDFGQEEMKAAGLTTASNWDFKSFDDALEFLKANPGRYVVKPSGQAQNEKELLYVGQDDTGQDVEQILRLYKDSWGSKIKRFQLQKYVSGVEVAVGAFFNGKEFITPININFEHKRLFPGEVGPSTGEMGTTMLWSPRNTVFDETLGKMQDRLAKSGYVGYIDINNIANNRGIYPLEFTSRFGYPTISIQQEGITSNWGEFLFGIAKGEKPELKARKGFQVGVVVACPPFPFTDPDAFKKYSEDAPVLFKKNSNGPLPEGIHIGDVKLVDGVLRLAGQSGYALIVTGSGITMEDAREQVYRRVQNIVIPNMFYRTDIGNRWYTDSDKLHSWGYLYGQT
jgi:phosphoribosylamine--glycine ligase